MLLIKREVAMRKIRRYLKERYPTVPLGIVVTTYAVGLPLALFVAYKFINFLNNYIDFVNPSPLEILSLLILGLSFSYLGYYALRRGLGK